MGWARMSSGRPSVRKSKPACRFPREAIQLVGNARRPEVRPSEPLEIPALGRESIPAREASAAESLPAPETPAAPPDTEPPPGGP